MLDSSTVDLHTGAKRPIWRSPAWQLAAVAKYCLMSFLESFRFCMVASISACGHSGCLALAASNDAVLSIPWLQLPQFHFKLASSMRSTESWLEMWHMGNVTVWHLMVNRLPIALVVGGQSTSLSFYRRSLWVWTVHLQWICVLNRLRQLPQHGIGLQWSSRSCNVWVEGRSITWCLRIHPLPRFPRLWTDKLPPVKWSLLLSLIYLIYVVMCLPTCWDT